MRSSKRRAVALLVAFECLLLVVASAEFGAQGDPAQDRPIAFGVVLAAVFVAGNVLALLVAVLSSAAVLLRKRHPSRPRRKTRIGSSGRSSGV